MNFVGCVQVRSDRIKRFNEELRIAGRGVILG